MNSGIGGSTAQAELAFLAPWPTPAPAITAAERLVAMVLPREGGPTMIGPRFELGSLEASLGIEAEIMPHLCLRPTVAGTAPSLGGREARPGRGLPGG